MSGIYPRKSKLWLWYVDAKGKRQAASTGCNLNERTRAQSILDAIERRVAEERATGAPAGELTVKAYGERWIEGRPAQGVATAEDEARRLRLHAWPLIGDLPVKNLKPRHLRDMVRALRNKESDRGGLLAPRTVRHVYGTVRTMLHDAVVDEHLTANPCVLKKGELPGVIDKDPEWRDGAVFTRAEAEQLISDPRIPLDRRVWNGLLFLAGLRFGEAAALRWRHYDATQAPLGRLQVAVNWDGRAMKETSVKTERPRAVPVHLTLAKLLATWRLSGYHDLFGHHPGPEDLILPNREGRHRDGPRALLRFHEDLERLGLRKRRQHDCRRTFTSLARGDGARHDLIDWVTHGPSGSMIDAYTTLPWASLCAEVSKLKLDLREGATIIPIASLQAVGAGDCYTGCYTEEPETKKPPSYVSLGASFREREKGFEGEGLRPPSSVVVGTAAESHALAPADVDGERSEPGEGVAGVAAPISGPAEVTVALAEALATWSRDPDRVRLRATLLNLARSLGATVSAHCAANCELGELREVEGLGGTSERLPVPGGAPRKE